MDAEETHRLANQAKELKDDPAFQAAVLALRKQWFGQLMTDPGDHIMERVAQLRTLEMIAQQLQIFINDWNAAQKRKNNV